jgi:hypothetical protein
VSSKKWILSGAAFLVLFAVALLSIKPSPPPSIKLPNPNGYDDLVKAGQMLAGDMPDCNWSQSDEECLEGMRNYLKANEAALRLIRIGLSRESCVPNDSTRAYSGKYLPELASFKRVAQILAAEGTVAEAENRNNDAIESYLAAARLNEKMRGGLIMDALVGIATEAIGVNALQKLLDSMTRDQRQEIIKTLTELYSNRDSFDEIMANEKRYVRDASGLRGKISYLLMYRAMKRSEQKFETKLKFHRTRLGLFFTDLAVKNFESDKGRAPKTLQELVPEYLPFLPKDDFSGKDFIYRPLTNGYELYRVGADGKNNGGKPLVTKGMESPGDMVPNSPY